MVKLKIHRKRSCRSWWLQLQGVINYTRHYRRESGMIRICTRPCRQRQGRTSIHASTDFTWQSHCSRSELGVVIEWGFGGLRWVQVVQVILPKLVSRAVVCGTQLFLTHIKVDCLLCLHEGSLFHNLCFTYANATRKKCIWLWEWNTWTFSWATPINRWVIYS